MVHRFKIYKNLLYLFVSVIFYLKIFYNIYNWDYLEFNFQLMFYKEIKRYSNFYLNSHMLRYKYGNKKYIHN